LRPRVLSLRFRMARSSSRPRSQTCSTRAHQLAANGELGSIHEVTSWTTTFRPSSNTW
jgi:hypothetical protein